MVFNESSVAHGLQRVEDRRATCGRGDTVNTCTAMRKTVRPSIQDNSHANDIHNSHANGIHNSHASDIHNSHAMTSTIAML